MPMTAQDFQETVEQLEGQSVKVASYMIGERYFCHVSNADPGATIARAEADNRDEARQAAIGKARWRLAPGRG